jgi:hypothetical protein
MKIFARSILIALLLIIAAPAYSDSGTKAIQIFNCEFSEGAIEEDVLKMASAWLKAAKGMPGGENLEAAMRFPIAEGSNGAGDFVFYISTPTFAEWGAFTDAYEGSPASIVDDEFDDLVDCGDSTVWEMQKVK